jgi:hypothetical protein
MKTFMVIRGATEGQVRGPPAKNAIIWNFNRQIGLSIELNQGR